MSTQNPLPEVVNVQNEEPHTLQERIIRHSRKAAVAGVKIAGLGIGAAVITSPLTAQIALENVQFEESLATVPVEVSVSRNGVSTLDAGILGDIYYDKSGPFDFGLRARATSPPEAGGTLASYVNPAYVQRNLAYLDSPDKLVDAYTEKLVDEFRRKFLLGSLGIAAVAGPILYRELQLRKNKKNTSTGPAAKLTKAAALGAVLILPTAAAGYELNRWTDAQEIGPKIEFSEVPGLSFSSPELYEVARQVKPAYEKNQLRTEQDANAYIEKAETTFRSELRDKLTGLTPKEGEKIIIAEGDTQGSYVGVDVRRVAYDLLMEELGADRMAFRTISGDITSNGTVAEANYVEAESEVLDEVPVVAIGGDHDSEETWGQLQDHGFFTPDFATETFGSLTVAGAHDREHKKLFGGIVTNASGISEEDLGQKLREVVDDHKSPVITLLHQPEAVGAYLGLDSMDQVYDLEENTNFSHTVPYEDGFPDMPAGAISIGHLHAANGPWVLWNTDGDQVTWTYVTQLGTGGGVESTPTFNRFSTPFSAPLRPIEIEIQYFNEETGLVTGFAHIRWDIEGNAFISERTDIGLSGGQPLDVIQAESGSRQSEERVSKQPGFPGALMSKQHPLSRFLVPTP